MKHTKNEVTKEALRLGVRVTVGADLGNGVRYFWEVDRKDGATVQGLVLGTAAFYEWLDGFHVARDAARGRP